MISVSGREGQRLVLAVERIGWTRAPLSVPVSILHLNTSFPNQGTDYIVNYLMFLGNLYRI